MNAPFRVAPTPYTLPSTRHDEEARVTIWYRTPAPKHAEIDELVAALDRIEHRRREFELVAEARSERWMKVAHLAAQRESGCLRAAEEEVLGRAESAVAVMDERLAELEDVADPVTTQAAYHDAFARLCMACIVEVEAYVEAVGKRQRMRWPSTLEQSVKWLCALDRGHWQAISMCLRQKGLVFDTDVGKS